MSLPSVFLILLKDGKVCSFEGAIRYVLPETRPILFIDAMWNKEILDPAVI